MTTAANALDAPPPPARAGVRPEPLPQLDAIVPYKAGESRLPGHEHPIKLSSNENPLGPSPAARAAFAAAAADLALYPEGSAAALRTAIAGATGLEADRIVCSAGSDELFQLLGRAFLAPGDEIIQSQYGFLVYRLVAQQCGAHTRAAPDRDYTADVDAMLALVHERTRIVFLANPNNPTGTYVPAQDIARLHAGLPPHVLLVLDAAYAEYVRRPDYDPGHALAREHQNVLVTRTFSKIHGLANARLGWAHGPAHVIDAIHRVRGPFNVAGPAMAAGIAAIGDAAHAEASADHNDAELAILQAELGAMGFTLTPSVCNFVLVHFPPGHERGGAAAADAHLRAHGYIVRALGAYGLPDALRISVGTRVQNAGLIEALRAFATA
jgi:histidinol-phosphate aminotransferase